MGNMLKFTIYNLQFTKNSQINKFSKKIRSTLGFTLALTLLLLTTYYLQLTTISAEPNCDSPGPGDIDFCLSRIEQEINALKPAHEYNKKELSDLKVQVTSLEKRIAGLSNQLVVKEKDINAKEVDLEFAQKIFEEKTESHYKFLRLYDPILPFLSSEDATSAFRELAFRQRAANEDIKTMEKYAGDLVKLKEDKESLTKSKDRLAGLIKKVGDRA